jgi:hypothetical protein
VRPEVGTEHRGQPRHGVDGVPVVRVREHDGAADLRAWRRRLLDRQDEWAWHEPTDDQLAGYGWHMSQMLYRLPKDSQTHDMQASIERLLADHEAALDALAAAEQRVVEAQAEALEEAAEALATRPMIVNLAPGEPQPPGSGALAARWLRDRAARIRRAATTEGGA